MSKGVSRFPVAQDTIIAIAAAQQLLAVVCAISGTSYATFLLVPAVDICAAQSGAANNIVIANLRDTGMESRVTADPERWLGQSHQGDCELSWLQWN